MSWNLEIYLTFRKLVGISLLMLAVDYWKRTFPRQAQGQIQKISKEGPKGLNGSADTWSGDVGSLLYRVLFWKGANHILALLKLDFGPAGSPGSAPGQTCWMQSVLEGLLALPPPSVPLWYSGPGYGTMIMGLWHSPGRYRELTSPTSVLHLWPCLPFRYSHFIRKRRLNLASILFQCRR